MYSFLHTLVTISRENSHDLFSAEKRERERHWQVNLVQLTGISFPHESPNIKGNMLHEKLKEYNFPLLVIC